MTLSTISIPATERAFEAYQRCCCTQSRRSSSSTQRRISSAEMPCTRSLIAGLLLLGLDQLEPEEAAGAQRQQVRELADPREARVPEHLDRIAPLVGGEIELDRLGGAGHVVDAQHDVVLEAADVGEDARVGRLDRLVGAEAEHRVLLAQRDEPVKPSEQARRRA